MKENDKDGLSNQQHIKDEFSSKSKGEQKSHSEKGPNHDQNISHGDLVNKLDTYSKTNIEENVKDYFTFQKMKEKYLSDMKLADENRAKGRVHYQKGMDSGLPHSDYSKIEQDHQRYDQSQRNNVAKEAKEIYGKNNSLKIEFDTKSSKETGEKSKGIDMDK